ncbi:protein of unknown function [Methanoculleus bourgensis]|uniref:Uncharacterized protein n=1 Tax=Methanoculleus bourgensis TaxID=83986 RepID=A0A0X3BKK3_9EURY|nr:protein of unknown function [Methanoculleus bourgensis]
MGLLPERGINQEAHQHDAAGPQTKAVKVCGQKNTAPWAGMCPGLKPCSRASLFCGEHVSSAITGGGFWHRHRPRAARRWCR